MLPCFLNLIYYYLPCFNLDKCFSVNTDTKTTYNAAYGQFTVVGDDMNDTVCVQDQNKYCVKNFRFLDILKVKSQMAPMDGVIGLAPDDPSNGPSFIATLADQGKIDKKMVGLLLTTVN